MGLDTCECKSLAEVAAVYGDHVYHYLEKGNIMGNCQGDWDHSNGKGGYYCYVKQPTSCKDAKHHPYIKDELYSVQPCPIPGNLKLLN